MAEPYKKLTEDTSGGFSNLTPSHHGQLDSNQRPQEQPMVCVASPVNSQPLKAYAPRTMQLSAILQLGIAILIFVLTIGLFIASSSGGGFMIAPVDGTGIWNGVLGIIAGSFGVAATLRMRQRGRCLMITYMVLSIIVCVGMGVLIIMSSIWAHTVSYNFERYERYQKNLAQWELERSLAEHNRITTTTSESPSWYNSNNGMRDRPTYYGPGISTVRSVYGLNLTLVFLGFIHLISTIISLALICYNWNKNGGCCGSNDAYAPNVMYIPATNITQAQLGGQNQAQFVIVPVGALQQHQQVSVGPTAVPLLATAPPSGANAPPAYFEAQKGV